MINVGLGSSKITPDLGVLMAGYFHERRATAVHDDLYAKAVLFDDGKRIVGIISCDLIGLDQEEVTKIRDLASKEIGLDGRNIMVCATHTHTGPYTSISDIPKNEEITRRWIEKLPILVVEALSVAKSDLEPCSICHGVAYEDRIAFNRRYKMRDGTVQTNPGYKNPDIIEPAGPIDPEVGVLAFKRSNGKLKGIYVNYACHLDCVGGTEISADYPGYMARRLQERLEDKPFVIFTNGACGDINHIDVRSPYRRQGHEHSRWMGETLAGDVCEALRDMKELDVQDVSAIGKIVELPVREDVEKTVGQCEIQAIRVGCIGFVGIPAEYFVELQLDIKKRSPLKPTFVSELANGCVGYVPTKRAFEENMKHVSAEPMKSFDHKGYEVRSALSHGFLPGVGEVMADSAVELLEKLR